MLWEAESILRTMADRGTGTIDGRGSRLAAATARLRELEARLIEGGGPDKVARQHEQGKLTARERIELLRDPGSRLLEIGLLVAWDRYEGQAPAAGVITGLTAIAGRPNWRMGRLIRGARFR